MNIEIFEKFTLLFNELFTEKEARIKWRKEGIGLEFTNFGEGKIENFSKEYEIDESEAIEAAFDLIKIARLEAFGSVDEFIKDLKDEESERFQKKQEIVNQYFMTPERSHYINVKAGSNSKVLTNFEYEVLTKRNKKNINEILTHSILLNLSLRDPHVDGEVHSNESNSFELTYQELVKMRKKLDEAINDLDNLNNNREGFK